MSQQAPWNSSGTQIIDAIIDSFETALPRALESADVSAMEAVPELEHPPHHIQFGHREGAAAVRRLLGAYEGVLERLCSRYDYRTLLYLSRLCAGLPQLRQAEGEFLHAQRRTLTADLAAVAYGARDLHERMVNVDDEGGYWFPDFSGQFAADLIQLHLLAFFHRDALDQLRNLSYLECFAKVNRTTAPEVKLTLRGNVDLWVLENEAVVAQQLYSRFQGDFAGDWSDLGWARLVGPQMSSPAVISMVPEEREPDEHWAGTAMYRVEHRGLGSLYELGTRFRALFEARLGMPPEHLCAILEGLAQLNMKLEGITNEEGSELYVSKRFALTGLMVVRQTDITGGTLLEEAARALSYYYPNSPSAQHLTTSLQRFVALASSSGKADNISLRRLGPSYLLHGEPHHKDWIIDYSASWRFHREVINMLEISHQTRGAGEPKRHDADVRTSAFDIELAQYLTEVDGVELAFTDLKRDDPNLPNFTFIWPAGGTQELDVPLKIGDVLIAVQTMASPLDPAVDEGDPHALERRWEVMRRKLRDTDKAYGGKLMSNPESRRVLKASGFQYVLPVLCVPHPEPVVSAKPRYWLRPVSAETIDTVRGGTARAVPRILTPRQLAGFLEDASAEELQQLCRRNEWSL